MVAGALVLTDTTPENLKRAAYGLSGHAVLQFAMLGAYTNLVLDPHVVQAMPEKSESGLVNEAASKLHPKDGEAYFMRQAITYYAVEEAVMRLTGAPRGSCNQEIAGRRARMYVDECTRDEPSAELLIPYLRCRAAFLVKHYWLEIDLVAETLIESRKLQGSEFARLFSKSRNARIECGDSSVLLYW